MDIRDSLPQHRCFNCRSLLFKGRIENAYVEIKCNKCGIINKVFTKIKAGIKQVLAA
jgi:phage FluMu protein Com